MDADLRDYFNSIPHAPLMRSLGRRIADGRILHVIKQTLAHSAGGGGHRRAVGADRRSAKDEAGNPAGRSDFAAAGKLLLPALPASLARPVAIGTELDAHVVNYADDFVICCRPGNASAAMARMATLMTRLGLEVNANKTRIARLPEDLSIFSGIRSVASTAKTGTRISALGRRGSQ